MTSITKSILVVLIFVAALLTVGNVSSANAATSANMIESVQKSDWLIFSRIVEPSGESYIYVFTDGGVFITKYEEL